MSQKETEMVVLMVDGTKFMQATSVGSMLRVIADDISPKPSMSGFELALMLRAIAEQIEQPLEQVQ